jgi:hypothetical protein
VPATKRLFGSFGAFGEISWLIYFFVRSRNEIEFFTTEITGFHGEKKKAF